MQYWLLGLLYLFVFSRSGCKTAYALLLDVL